MSNSPMESNACDHERRLDELLRAYRAACPDVDAGANFMPDLWAKIEARGTSGRWFSRIAKVLAATGFTASAILSLAVASTNSASPFSPVFYFNATFVQALTEERVATFEPFQLDRISELEQP